MLKQVYLNKTITSTSRVEWQIFSESFKASSTENSDWQVSAISVDARGHYSVWIEIPELAMPGSYSVVVRGESYRFLFNWFYSGSFVIE